MADEVRRIQDEGLLGHPWNLMWSHPQETALANFTALMIAVDGPTDSPDERNWADRLSINPELPNAVGQALEGMNVSRDLVWLMSRMRGRPQDAPLLRGLAGRLIESSNYEVADKAIVLNDVTSFDDLIPPESRAQFWQDLVGQEGFWTELDKREAKDQAAVLHILARTLSNRARLGRALKAHLDDYDRSVWIQAAEEGGEPYPFLEDLDRIQSSIHLGSAAYAALRDIIPTLLSTIDDGYRERWFKLAVRLKSELHRTLLRMLADALVAGVPAAHLPRILVLGGSDLIDALHNQPDRIVLRIVSVLAETDEGLRWLTENIQIVQGWVAKSTKDTRFTLAEQLKAANGDTTASALCVKLGL